MAIFRFEANGPAGQGMVPLELSSEDFQSELPHQEWHIYYQDETLGLTAGVWTTTSMQEAFGPYPGDEFMHILEGKVLLLDADENQTFVNTGETFVVKNGIPISWKQDGFCRKFFMTFYAPDTKVKPSEGAANGISILRENELEHELIETKSSQGIVQREADVFTNEAGNMNVGMWETEAFETPMEPFPVHEFAQMISGEVVITDGEGGTHPFSAGDCFFIAAGTVCSWKSEAAFRKFYCSLEPVANG